MQVKLGGIDHAVDSGAPSVAKSSVPSVTAKGNHTLAEDLLVETLVRNSERLDRWHTLSESFSSFNEVSKLLRGFRDSTSRRPSEAASHSTSASFSIWLSAKEKLALLTSAKSHETHNFSAVAIATLSSASKSMYEEVLRCDRGFHSFVLRQCGEHCDVVKVQQPGFLKTKRQKRS